MVVLQGATGDPYRGPDRRGRNDGLLAPVGLSRVVLMSVVVTVGAWIPALFLLPRHPSAAGLGAYAAIAAGLVYAVAGGTWLIIWKVAGRAAFAWFGAAYVVLGVMLAVSDGLSGFGAPTPAVRPLDELLAAAIAGWLIWRGLTDNEVDSGLRPIVTVACALGGGLAGTGVLNATQATRLLPAWTSARGSEIGFALASALVWIAVAVLAGGAVRRGRVGVSPWAVYVAGLLAVGSGVRALSPLPWASTLAASACLFSAAALVLGTSITRVQEILTSRDRSHRRLQLALTATVRQAAHDRRALEAWLHDVRNAVAGLQAADDLLRTGLRTGIRAAPELADAVTAELARLHALIDPARQLQIAEIDLGATLGPIVAAERARGTSIDLRLEARAALADPVALSRVVQNLLTNARLYGGGSAVTVAAARRGHMVELWVHDGGPGIAPGERSTVFERGQRGAASWGIDGNGLGLYVVRTLVAAMGGSVAVASDGAPGCRIVVCLPAPSVAVATAAAPSASEPGPWRAPAGARARATA